MPLQSSGRITLKQIADYYGGTGPHKLSEYAKGGARVWNTSVNKNVGSAGNRNSLKKYYSTGNPKITVLKTQTGSGQLLHNVTVNTEPGELGPNTRLLIGMGFHSSVGYGGASANATCSITGKTVKEIFDVGNWDDSDRQGSSHFTCNLGNESSFKIKLTRGSTNRAGRAAIIQIDNMKSVSSPAVKSSTSAGSMQRTMTINDKEGISFYVGQTSFDSFKSHSRFSSTTYYIRDIHANNTRMNHIFGRAGTPGGNICYLASNNHPSGSVVFGPKGNDYHNNRANPEGERMIVGVAYYPF